MDGMTIHTKLRMKWVREKMDGITVEVLSSTSSKVLSLTELIFQTFSPS